MNKTDRKEIEHLKAELEGLHAQCDEHHTSVDTLASAERDKFDNMSEGLQQSEKGQVIEAAADALEEARDAIDEAMTSLQNAIDKLEEAVA